MQAGYAKEQLKQYFEDLQKLFLKRFNVLVIEGRREKNAERQLIELIREIFYIQSMIDKK